MSDKKEIRPRLTQERYDLLLLIEERMKELGVDLSTVGSDPAPQLAPPAKAVNTPQQKKFTKPGLYLLLGCVHAPGHNVSMMNGITELIIDYRDQIKGFVLMGDFLDMNTLSGHDTGRFAAVPGLTLDQEYQDGRVLLNQLIHQLEHPTEKIYIYGNHEDRWNRYMSEMESSKRPLPSPAEGLGLIEKGFKVYSSWKDDHVTLGEHLDVFHGQYYNVHCAKKTIDTFRGSVAFVHSHRIQTYIEGRTGGFNIGWGGDVTSPFFNYMPRGTKSMWQNGFAMVNISEKGDYYLEQIIHHSGRFYYGGKKYN